MQIRPIVTFIALHNDSILYSTTTQDKFLKL